MKQHISIPNTPRYISAVALASDPAATLAILLEAGAIDAKGIGLARQIRQSLVDGYTRMSDVPTEQLDWDVYGVVGEIITALESPDFQAYLAFRLRDLQSGEALIDALAVVHGAHYYRTRPWDTGADKHALEVLRRVDTTFSPAQLSAPVTSLPATGDEP